MVCQRLLSALSGLLLSGLACFAIAPLLGSPAEAQAITCPGPGGGPSGARQCRYRFDAANYYPTPEGGPWVHVDLLSITKERLQALRDGSTKQPVFPGGGAPVLPRLGIVHAYICLSSSPSPANNCPNYGTLGASGATWSIPEQLKDKLALVRETGLKVILRFIYNFGPETSHYDAGDSTCGVTNVPPDRFISDILTDMQAVSTVVLENADVIYALEAGFIGYWGEWHNSSCSENATPDAHNIFLDQLRSTFQSRLNLEVRYPYVLLDYAKHKGSAPPNYRALRLGIHNDAFASSRDDLGTFTRKEGYPPGKLRAAAQAAGAALTTTGEFAQPYPPRQGCRPFLRYARRYSLSSQNIQSVSSVLKGWYDSKPPCYAGIMRAIGPHLALDSASFSPAGMAPGLGLTVRVSLRNFGMSRFARNRPILLYARKTSDSAPFQIGTLDGDLTRLPPDGAAPLLLTGRARLPGRGTYDLLLRLPDPHPRLAGRDEYALPVENVGVGNVFPGYGLLGQITY
ncbi:MAG: hypothetical protein B7Y12_00785 [Rhizobiales bacterium 24-66-13]|jgi:hypothetical protein|nr:MAG: hypothetical protein B7Y95_21155 [Rhizobiales bacterium 32-66-11]OYY88369.1 MAG: hypothetical protein B7Y61_02700 [Rhizobiales bacterium 35-66-30]OYZ83135.1 MAG: hypothetical protein B7Y12_00785 [Rhizobiales bacterium 24-66-13]OZB11320.1 MAG: hypothetical protein B7X67_04355 [Rhizobiales bacterium 39-66-18]HQS47732.1 DUF4874 domain-containing protein [Xanthobacteraceae bacterium]